LKLLSILPFLLLSLLAQGQTPKPGASRLPPRLLVYLDPGHGGDDLGATGPKGLQEKDAALDLAAALALQLGESGMEVRLTRRSDVFIPLWDRARLANEAGADLFISLHLNAARAKGAKGSEVYFLTLGAGDRDAQSLAAQENAGAAQGSPSPDSVVAGILEDLSQKAYLQDSERLAVAIQGQLNLLGGIRQRGVKQAPFVVLRGAAMPAVLVETAFISNAKEEAKLRSPLFHQKVAEAITLGVRAFFAEGAVTPRRKAMAN
jgi:N-acetylmuramoyl-L-alanine amidase